MRQRTIQLSGSQQQKLQDCRDHDLRPDIRERCTGGWIGMKKADWNGYRVGGRAAIAAGPFAEREAAVERLRQGPGPEAQPESAVPPSRWTLRTIRATFGVLHDYTLSGVWRWLRQDILKLHRLASDAKRLRQRVNNFLDQFAPGSRALLQYVGLLGEGQLAKAIPER